MKKLMAVFMSVMIGVSITGCSDFGGGSNSETEAENNFANETIMPDVIDGEDEAAEIREFRQDIFIDETVLYDESGVKITATELNYESNRIDLKILIENNSDEELTFSSGSTRHNANSINGYMVDDSFFRSIPAGKKDVVTLTYYYHDLELLGIWQIAEFVIDVEITDKNYDSIYTGPLQIKTSAYDSYDFSEDTYLKMITDENAMKEHRYEYSLNYFSEDIFYEKDGIKLISEAIVRNKWGRDTLFLEFVNDSDQTVFISVRDFSLNGLITYSGGVEGYTVCAGKRCVAELYFPQIVNDSLLELVGINEIGNIGFNLRLLDEEREERLDTVEMNIKLSETDTGFDASGDELYSKNDFRIISKKAVDDIDDYSSRVYICMLAENNGTEDITVRDAWNSFSVNGFMTSSYLSDTIPAGRTAAIIIYITDSDMDKTGISSAADITDYEITFKISSEETDETDEVVISERFD